MNRPPASPRSPVASAELYPEQDESEGSTLARPWSEWRERNERSERARRAAAVTEAIATQSFAPDFAQTELSMAPMGHEALDETLKVRTGMEERQDRTQVMIAAPPRLSDIVPAAPTPSSVPPRAPPQPHASYAAPPPHSPPTPFHAAPRAGWPPSSVQPLPATLAMHAVQPAPALPPPPAPYPAPAPYPNMSPPTPVSGSAPPAHYGSYAPPPHFAAAASRLSAMPQPARGLPSAVAFALGLAAIVVALFFDVVFLHVHIPGVGGYAWYLTTALAFGGAGYGGMRWTRASQGLVYTTIGIVGVIYGVADAALCLVLENITFGEALSLGIQGLVIAVLCGGAGVRKAYAEEDDDVSHHDHDDD